ncbi:reverse transcriptase domain-containing protein [Tanacetum coccineum]|uniref:Reverse transcriptase domain-containing protein n=1 Tax=Tanacetum coccineum TaxID=301880 RepID=A0ABQ5CUT3_9ASTR
MEILPTLTALIKGEVLVMYLAASTKSISVVLLAEREGKQISIYFVSRVLQGAELNYPILEKVILALVHAARRLRRATDSTRNGNQKLGYLRRFPVNGKPGKGSIRIQVAGNQAIPPKDALNKLASMTFEHLTKEVLVEVLAKRSVEDREVSKIDTEKEENWMTPIYEYLLSGPLQANSVIKDIHNGSCGFNPEPRSMVVKIMKQEQPMVKKASGKEAITTRSTWPFSHWGVNILGPLPTALGSIKYLAIAVKHSTKWAEAKPLTSMNEKQAKKFV